MNLTNTTKEARTANSTYPKGGVSCSADTFVQAESLVLRMKFCAKNPAASPSRKTLVESPIQHHRFPKHNQLQHIRFREIPIFAKKAAQ